MIADGKRIAQDLRDTYAKEIRDRRLSLSVAIVVTQDDPVIERFISAKVKFAEAIGVRIHVERQGPLEHGDAIIGKLFHLVREHNGIVVQLPLARGITTEDVYRVLPITHDVDILGNTAYEQYRDGKLAILPPVIGACAEILHHYKMSVAGKQVTIIGEGRLVGAPARIWAQRFGGIVTVVTKETPDFGEKIATADVIVSGAGAPGLIKPDMVKDGVIILDAGTSESAGAIVGDADPTCADKAALFTPTPGGIGPLTVAMIFKNLLALHELKNKSA